MSAAVAGGDVQLQAVVSGGQRFRRLHARQDRSVEAAALADEAQSCTEAMQFLDLALQRAQEQFHQAADFLAGPVPVLAGEGEQGQCADCVLQAELDAALDRTRAGAMADDPRPVALLRPAAIAIHDDGQMLRDGARAVCPAHANRPSRAQARQGRAVPGGRSVQTVRDCRRAPR